MEVNFYIDPCKFNFHGSYTSTEEVNKSTSIEVFLPPIYFRGASWKQVCAKYRTTRRIPCLYHIDYASTFIYTSMGINLSPGMETLSHGSAGTFHGFTPSFIWSHLVNRPTQRPSSLPNCGTITTKWGIQNRVTRSAEPHQTCLLRKTIVNTMV